MAWVPVIISLLSLLFGSGVLMTIWKSLQKREDEKEQVYAALKAGLQALLRSELLYIYKEAEKTRSADFDTKSNFENLWRQYHSLGANGVMDSIHENFLSFETRGGDNGQL